MAARNVARNHFFLWSHALFCVRVRCSLSLSAEDHAQQTPDAESGSVVDAIVGGLAWIGEPSPTPRRAQAQGGLHGAGEGRAGGDALAD